MVQLFTTIVLIGLCIGCGSQLLRMRAWHRWMTILVEIYMKGEHQTQKRVVEMNLSRTRFPRMSAMLPQRIYETVMFDRKQRQNDPQAMKQYAYILRGIAMYGEDYQEILHRIDGYDKER